MEDRIEEDRTVLRPGGKRPVETSRRRRASSDVHGMKVADEWMRVVANRVSAEVWS